MIVIALGANLPSQIGTPEQTIRAALSALEREGVRPVAVSRFYSSPAWPDASDPTYVNAVAIVETSLDVSGLLNKLLEVEKRFGRTRGEKNAPRTLDIDLIDYDGVVQDGSPHLPHPRMHERGFVLLPLNDVAPEWRHPVSGKTLPDLISALPENVRRNMNPIST